MVRSFRYASGESKIRAKMLPSDLATRKSTALGQSCPRVKVRQIVSKAK